MDCLFCKIANKQLPSDIVYETKEVLVFKDINPKAETHYLILPKEHIESVMSAGSEKVIEKLIKTAKEIAEKGKIEGFKLVFNVGQKGGQTVPHLHMHFLSGEQMQTELTPEV